LGYTGLWKISEAGLPSGNPENLNELQAPEMQNLNTQAYTSQRFDYWRSEAYSVGVILLQAATLRPREELGNLKKLGGLPGMQFINDLMNQVTELYGEYLWKVYITVYSKNIK
jgi:hypothetical protein